MFIYEIIRYWGMSTSDSILEPIQTEYNIRAMFVFYLPSFSLSLSLILLQCVLCATITAALIVYSSAFLRLRCRSLIHTESSSVVSLNARSLVCRTLSCTSPHRKLWKEWKASIAQHTQQYVRSVPFSLPHNWIFFSIGFFFAKRFVGRIALTILI